MIPPLSSKKRARRRPKRSKSPRKRRKRLNSNPKVSLTSPENPEFTKIEILQDRPRVIKTLILASISSRRKVKRQASRSMTRRMTFSTRLPTLRSSPGRTVAVGSAVVVAEEASEAVTTRTTSSGTVESVVVEVSEVPSVANVAAVVAISTGDQAMVVSMEGARSTLTS